VPTQGIAALESSADTGALAGSARILVIGEETHTFSSISRALRDHGFSVSVARGVSEGLQLAGGGGYGLIVLDVGTGDVEGTETLRALIAAVADQPVMVLSELTDVEFHVGCLEQGAVDFITRPFATGELIARARTRLRPPVPASDGRFLRVDDLTLDLQRHVVHNGGGEAALSRREFDLLLYLMRRPGAVCTRAELLAGVWQTPFDPGTNVVDVYVRRLRHKLGDYRIETRRRVGYSLRVS
jgi:two-component system OmpR family response regulator